MLRKTGFALCDEANERVLAALVAPDRELRFISSLDAGLARCDRTCMNLYADMRGLVNRKIDLAVNVLNLIGAQPQVARGAVDVMRRVEAASDDDMLRAAFDLVDRLSVERGQSVEQLRASLAVHEGERNGNS